MTNSQIAKTSRFMHAGRGVWPTMSVARFLLASLATFLFLAGGSGAIILFCLAGGFGDRNMWIAGGVCVFFPVAIVSVIWTRWLVRLARGKTGPGVFSSSSSSD